MNERHMENKNRQAPSRIPVRFVDDESGRGGEASGGAGQGAGGGELTPEEIGEQSIYEDETDAQRRIDRGEEKDSEQGRESADDADAAGGPDPKDLPRSRTDLDTTQQHDPGGDRERKAFDNEEGSSASSSSSGASSSGAGAGPVMAELVATRAELKRVEAELKKLADERHELTDRLARRQADFENYRKRTERERTEAYNRATGEVVGRLLPVLDNLRRALDAEKSYEAGESDEFGHFLRGVELIEKQLAGVLEGLGVEPVPTVGEKFDPHIHEAVVTEETSEYAPDTVMEEMRRGYRLGDKLIRPAMVKVSK